MKFERSLWKKQDDFDEPDGYTQYRCKMYRDFTTNYLRPGLSAAQVHHLLGDDYVVSYCLEKEPYYIWTDVGSCFVGLGGQSSDYIRMYFDSNDKLLKFSDDGIHKNFCNYKEVSCYEDGHCVRYERQSNGQEAKVWFPPEYITKHAEFRKRLEEEAKQLKLKLK